MSSVERSMNSTLPGMVMEDFTVDKQLPVNTALSEGTNVAIEQRAQEKKSKGKGGFIKRAWKGVKRAFRRSSHETNVEAMVQDTTIPCASSDGEEICAQLSSVSGPCQLPIADLPPKEDRCDDLDVVSITSSDWSVCKRTCRQTIQQNSELPADASAEDVETIPQEQHVNEERRNGICAQLSSISGPCQLPIADLPPKEDRCDDLDVVSITSSDWSVCKRTCRQTIQQNSELPADASAEDVETKPQEQHVNEERRNGKEEKKKEKEEKMKKKEKEKEEKKKEEEEKKKAKEKKMKKKEKEKEEKAEEKKKRERQRREEERKRREKEKERERQRREKERKRREKEKERERQRREKERKRREKEKKEKDKEEKKNEKEEKKKEKDKEEKKKEKEEKKKETEEEKKRNGPVIKRAWKGVKRAFRRSSHETNVEAMVQDTAIPCASSDGEEIFAQLSSVSGPCQLPIADLPPKEDRCDDLDVVSITSSDWSVCNRTCRQTIQQNSELPADASVEDVETKPQEQHVKEEKQDHIDFSMRVAIFLDDQRWKLIKLRMTRDDYRRRWQYYMFIRRCPHHRCCDHDHLCCLRNDTIYLGAREQLMSTVPSVTRPFLIFPKQSRNEPFREHNPEEEDGVKKDGIFKRKWTAVKLRLFRCESRRTLYRKNLQKLVSDFKCSTYIERIIYERPFLSVPPMFQPSNESFDSSYSDEYVILGIERFGNVCLATRLSDGQKVAFKQCNRYDYGTSTYIMAGYTERLMNEVAMMTLLKQPPISPYIIQMLEWFHEEYDTFIILEDPGSWTVLDKIIKHHPVGEKVARVIMRQAVQAAQHCIAHGVFHYFIDEENILINTNTLDIKLIDFGYSMPYMGKKYYRLGDTVESEEKHPEWSLPEYEYSAISVNACQLGWLLHRMVYGPYGHLLEKCFQISNECTSLIDWCTHYEMTERPTLEQILQHRWFTKE